MEKSSSIGAWLVSVAALAGLAVCVANYFNPQSGIAGEPGTVLVIASTALLALFGLLMGADRRRGTFLRIFILVSALLNIAGTAFAGYLLHSTALVVLMMAALAGWLLHVVGRRKPLATARLSR
ncbi:MAG TPA: hypothetical protein VLQ68_08875 [Rhizobiaceae bacterium]|nr:hypothetical protein [Rhizobiaceae bacterium]